MQKEYYTQEDINNLRYNNNYSRDDLIDLIEYVQSNSLITWKDEAGDILENFLKERSKSAGK